MAIPNFSALNVLVADDSLQMRRLLLAMLNAIGVWNVRTAIDGREAFDSFSQQRPDILITDADMGQVGGMELVRSVRRYQDQTGPYVPIIMVTGHTEQSWVEEARDAGVDEFLAKPISAGSLYVRVCEVILNPRPFVRSSDYLGPDRRRRDSSNYEGPMRRQEDVRLTGAGDHAIQVQTKQI
ncbi:MAG: response regulator [Alphaproteobacteria bacterium]